MSIGFGGGQRRGASRVFPAVLSIALASAVLLAGPAEARLGGGGSFGSRGARTFSMPSATPTAPRIAPLQRSQTAAPFNSGYGNGFARPGFFGGGGFGRGLIGGFLGAGLFGLLFGGGLTGGLGGGGSLIGLLLQLGLLYLAFRFIMGIVRRQPAFGGGGASYVSGGAPAGGGGFGGVAGTGRGVPITIGPEDYAVFERRLLESQTAYSAGDLGRLRQLATPEMSGNFQEELANNARQGVTNRLSDVHLIQGDLSEAWREGNAEYASVAMRFSLIDVTLDRSGQVVAGNATMPQQVTEVWTFIRPPGASPEAWSLSAIQQA